MEHNFNNEWVADRMAAVKPEWTPNGNQAKVQLEASLAQRPSSRRRMALAATVAAAIFAVATLPQGKLVAHEVWYRLFFQGFDSVRMDLSRVPLAVSITSNGMLQTVQSAEQAEQLLGYRPMLPGSGMVGGKPELTVTGPIGVRQVIQVRELEAALAKVEAKDIQVPPEWQGLTLHIEIGLIVSADYPENIEVVQARPSVLYMPVGFPLAKFAEAAFRCTGLPWWQARAMGEKFASNPAWLLDVPEGEVVRVEEVIVRAGRGLLVEEFDKKGVSKSTVLFGSSGRVFAVSSDSRNRSILIADSLQ